MTDFILTPANNGQLLAGAPTNGTITGLRMTQSPDYRPWNMDKNTVDYWFSIKGTGEISNWASITVNLLNQEIPTLVGVFLPYQGDLFIYSVPRGSQFLLSLA